ncbi:PREDICTED: uncharacterized protein LOC105450422 [Wasmannia auropunctata]|uniref:uncharacterized protein LOC105450422 n=1 Tax=Wasmannia auropunctata TaxID=64793 RepID=UPI0005EF7644|nr:PREDICTED: uncharacterized protein LOC105450422 [Wasmannia auropunctata]
MIITRSTVTSTAAVATTTTTAARWPFPLKQETLGRTTRTSCNVGGKRRRSTTDLHNDAVSAMLPRGCGRRVVHGNDNSNRNNSNTIEPQWISGSCTAFASVLPYYCYYYYYYQRIAFIGIVASLLANDDDDDVREDDDLTPARVPEQRDDDSAADNSGATTSSDERLLDRRNGLLRCCA